MEYTTTIKLIGGSVYLRLPPKLVRQCKFRDKTEVTLREADRMIIMDANRPKLDKDARDLLNMHFKLGVSDFPRKEIYETDRY
jgi:antitoxin component of MazEF toxin-antitoxin module